MRAAARGAAHGGAACLALFGRCSSWASIARPLLPAALKHKVPPRARARAAVAATANHARKMLVLEGCAQPALSPATNAAAARVLDRLGISLVRAPARPAAAARCRFISTHRTKRSTPCAATSMPGGRISKQGAEAIVITASGCGVMVKDYGHALAHDPAYAEKAQTRVGTGLRHQRRHRRRKSQTDNHTSRLTPHASRARSPFTPPCTLQHGLKKKGAVEALLTELGFELTPVADAHLCCGSAGTYSILQPELVQRTARQQDRGARIRRAARNPHRQYRLPDPSAIGDTPCRCGTGSKRWMRRH